MEELRRTKGREARSGPLTVHRYGFVQSLRDAGYSAKTIETYLCGVSKFGQWLSARGAADRDVDRAIVERFVAEQGRYHPPSCAVPRLPDTACAAHRLAEYLWKQGISDPHEGTVASSADCWLAQFDRYLLQLRGLSNATREDYGYYARKFVSHRPVAEQLDWAALRADEIAEFVRVESDRLTCGGRRRVATAMRALLGYLIFDGDIGAHLLGAVPTLRRWKDSALPTYLVAGELKRVIERCDLTTVLGRRDRAILLILARLGLRAGEVAALRLDDFDWHNASVLIRAAKTGRQRSLPVPHEVGQGIASYLQKGRRSSPQREMFLRIRAPFGPLTRSAITSVAQRALHKADLNLPRSGAHVFRHTLASHLVQGGASFKEIADILGHARIETTGIYAKVDLKKLAQIALPWPGERP